MNKSVRYVLFYDHPETKGKQVFWDGDTGTGKPKFYGSAQACLDDFVCLESLWGHSVYAVPPQIRAVRLTKIPGEFVEIGQNWQINIGDLSYSATPL